MWILSKNIVKSVKYGRHFLASVVCIFSSSSFVLYVVLALHTKYILQQHHNSSVFYYTPCIKKIMFCVWWLDILTCDRCPWLGWCCGEEKIFKMIYNSSIMLIFQFSFLKINLQLDFQVKIIMKILTIWIQLSIVCKKKRMKWINFINPVMQ